MAAGSVTIDAIRTVRPSVDRFADRTPLRRDPAPVALPEVADALADSLQGGIGLVNDVPFPIVRELVDEIVLVTEEEIALAMRHALREHRLVLEGAGAVGIAALSAGRIQPDGARVAVVCSGANVELGTIAEMAGLEAHG